MRRATYLRLTELSTQGGHGGEVAKITCSSCKCCCWEGEDTHSWVETLMLKGQQEGSSRMKHRMFENLGWRMQ
jgi:hypothetical protein